MSQWTHVAGVIRIDALRDGDERDIQQEEAFAILNMYVRDYPHFLATVFIFVKRENATIGTFPKGLLRQTLSVTNTLKTSSAG